MGTWILEVSDADESGTRFPNSPYVTTEFETICPFPTAPPNTEVYVNIGE